MLVLNDWVLRRDTRPVYFYSFIRSYELCPQLRPIVNLDSWPYGGELPVFHVNCYEHQQENVGVQGHPQTPDVFPAHMHHSENLFFVKLSRDEKDSSTAASSTWPK